MDICTVAIFTVNTITHLLFRYLLATVVTDHFTTLLIAHAAVL